MRKATEHQIQAAFFEWVEIQAQTRLIFGNIFAIPNGAYKSYKQALKFKREGLKAGVPDVFCAIPSGPWHGLFIEFKKPGGKLSPQQRTWADRLACTGYIFEVVYSADEAVQVVNRYLNEGRK